MKNVNRYETEIYTKNFKWRNGTPTNPGIYSGEICGHGFELFLNLTSQGAGRKCSGYYSVTMGEEKTSYSYTSVSFSLLLENAKRAARDLAWRIENE